MDTVAHKEKPKPHRHRHLPVEGSINSAMVEATLKQVGGKTVEELQDNLARRFGYPGRHSLVAVERRIARWHRHAAGDPRSRMPMHIKVKATVLELVRCCSTEWERRRELGFVGRAVEAVKGRAS